MSTFNTHNIKATVDALNKAGITNKHVQLGILATVSKESAFNPKTETSYANTPSSRIRMIFGSRMTPYTDAQIDALKKDYNKFYEAVYGHTTAVGKQLGNTQVGDGAAYVGRGLNGITGRAQYKIYGDLVGVDLIREPERLNEIDVAAAANAQYFKRKFADTHSLKNKIGVNSIDEIKDDTTGLKAALAANAGWGKNMNDDFHIENEKRALENIEYLKQFVQNTTNFDAKKMLPIFIIAISIGIATYLLVSVS